MYFLGQFDSAILVQGGIWSSAQPTTGDVQSNQEEQRFIKGKVL
jgi:hypothetical protein